MTAAALQVVDLHVWCAQAQILNGVSLHAMAGEAIVLLGRDGSGRRAALRAIIGSSGTRQGSVRITGQETIHGGRNDTGHLGVTFLPTQGGIYPHLTCEENLLLPITENNTPGGAMPLTQIYELCPDLGALRQTPGASLSRAEQRMLAIARMLRTGANVLLMDDIADGLAPVMVQALSSMLLSLKRQGYTLIMGERKIDFGARLADRFYVIDGGGIIDTLSAGDLPDHMERLHILLDTNHETH